MKKLLVFLLSLLFCFPISANAVTEAIDFNKKGSLSVTMECSHGYKSGGTVALYKIADVIWSDDHYTFQYTQAFKDCHIPLDNIGEDLAADEFVEYAYVNSITPQRAVLEDGTALFQDLSLGLYMIIQEEVVEGFNNALPFMVTVPVSNGGAWDYSVDASPKVETEHYEVTVPPDIPQTGQLKWPIPVMAASGVLLFAIGMVLLKRNKSR